MNGVQRRMALSRWRHSHARSYLAWLLALTITAASVVVRSVVATRPVAPYLVVEASFNSQVVITLRGYDKDGDKLTATLDSLPTGGKVYQLAQPYSKYGRTPMYEDSTLITSPNTNSTDVLNRIVYVAPSNRHAPNGRWDRFFYTVSDKTGKSARGTVDIIPPSRTLVGSDFTSDNDGWTVVDNGAGSGPATHDRTSRGLLNYFIFGSDNELNIVAGDEKTRWSFQAPSRFLGQLGASYGGTLSFVMAAFAGDFSSEKVHAERDLVILECSTCASGQGIRLKRSLGDLLTFDHKQTAFSLTLTETSGWLKDPKNTLESWTVPSQCEMVEVLDGLSKLTILGDHTNWYETVGIDTIRVNAPALTSHTSLIPVSCYCQPVGTHCTFTS